jgi:pyruvate/2-oxoglutarate dehydrogenase complex dihydrolipoamide acyltransferase (E2) component
MIVAEMCGLSEVLQILKAPPVIISKGDVHVGFNPIYEYAALPDKARIVAGMEHLLSMTLEMSLELGTTKIISENKTIKNSPADIVQTITTNNSPEMSKTITVPILGEGIRTARVVAILKQAGDTVKADDPLCEVETDKAVFPIECDADGVLGEWQIREDDEVKVGQELVSLKTTDPIAGDNRSNSASNAMKLPQNVEVAQASALSSEVISSMQRTIPATIEMTCDWEQVRDARLRSKKSPGGTLSTSTMTAWAVVEAMRKHQRFASVVNGERLVSDPDRFDLGVAVALPGDKLETAVVKHVNTLSWETFPDVFNQSLHRARQGEVDSKNRVSLTISSMSTYKVRSAIPVVVPPALATLFVGAPYLTVDPKSKDGSHREVVSLVLTFDHRWINGVGAAAFLSDVRKGIERFDLGLITKR